MIHYDTFLYLRVRFNNFDRLSDLLLASRGFAGIRRRVRKNQVGVLDLNLVFSFSVTYPG